MVPKLMSMAEVVAILGYLVQLVVSGLLLKLGWEMRWYMTSDTSLRIREGLVWVRERTMMVANIQNINVKQGPLQRLLGIWDVEVHSAGGGGSADGSGDARKGKGRAHVVRFRGLEDATGLCDQLGRSLLRHRDAGLGDPDRSFPPAVAEQPGPELRAAMRAMVEESRRLRRALETAAS